MKKSCTRSKKGYTPDEVEAIIRALRSPYCDFADDESFFDTPQLYFLMTTELEILGITDNPSDESDEYCVPANDHDFAFIIEFKKNWEDVNPYFWELEIYRDYYRARSNLYNIRRGYPETSIHQHFKKIDNIKRLP
ncbi:hypothetical protein [Pseudomonas sp. C2B4]|uniref:hypothetical protein n=1 Tax=Pseudomonas sp. C2B4 TaxID=2735270 RepID=UPI0015868A91|nr:hypothetical protein [Pseudomonas sp. C2B4]NUU34756.1 hypothetical protein [Pseudomonas sp. C2B4]